MPQTMETLNRKRGALKSKLTSSNNNFNEVKNTFDLLNNDEKEAKITEIELRIEKLELVWQQFEDVQDEIESLSEEYDAQLEERERFETTYFSQLSSMKQFVNKYNANKLTVSVEETCDDGSVKSMGSNRVITDGLAGIKLPQIKLPDFSGSYDQWLEFRDTFKSLIHENDQIGEIQKFHYLRAALQDSAAQMIHAIEFSASNYKIAWSLLCDRFDNKQLLINTHVKQLFNLPTITKEASSEFRKFIDQLSKNLRLLETLEQPVSSWDTLIIYLVTTKLDKVTIKEWETKKTSKVPTLEDMKEFLRHKADLLEALEFNQAEGKPSKPQQKSKAFTASNKQCCVVCKGMHYIYNCQQFLKLNISKRLERVNALRLCTKCLRLGHMKQDCKAGGCRKCGGIHNTLLHFEKRSQQDQEANVQGAYSSVTSVTNIPQVLLSTALVQIADKNGELHTYRALLDCGAQSNFITANVCNKLKLNKSRVNISVTGINQGALNITHKCNVQLNSLHYAFETTVSCLIIDKLSDTLPTYQFDYESCTLPSYIRLADPAYNQPSKIDIILGAGVFWNLLCVGQQRLANNSLTLQKTKLGWIVTGTIHAKQLTSQVNCNFIKNNELQDQLERFWRLENDSSDRILTAEETSCEDLFERTTKRNSDGRFIVQIPCKHSRELLGSSRAQALLRFTALERKFSKNPKFKAAYINFMSEYEKLQHMTILSTSSETDLINYLPHHGVIKESSSTTKLRVVFDGSAITTSGYSFNDIQMIGKSLQDELLTITLRFRQYPFVICADVEKMYRQILIDQDQRDMQCILWRADPNNELTTYTLNTVTYGTASAPYLAIKCLRQLGLEFQEEKPQAARVILSDFYMDDMMTGGDTEDEVIALANDVAGILKTGCFHLRKWISNSSKVLDALQSVIEDDIVNLGQQENTKTLGLYWTSKGDKLFFNINTEMPITVTKRTVLSQIAQIFDPMGLLSPVIIVAKIIIQQLWLCKIEWDETVPPDIFTRWKIFREELTLINNLKIPRLVICANSKIVQLHGFADASKDAYGASVYIRSISENGEIQVNLLFAKSKVAPLKLTTIPRLELCAATMLAKLMDKCKRSMRLEISNTFYWSDSTVTLHWINTNANILHVFVANRVTQIQNLTKIEDWRHISTHDNPADFLSRGLTPKEIVENDLWWHGPSWLCETQLQWPTSILEFNEDPLESKKAIKVLLISTENTLIDITKYSSFVKIQRIIAYCLRFINNCKLQNSEREKGVLKCSELLRSSQTLIKYDQNLTFKQEINELRENKQVTKKSSLYKLNPFLDDANIIRVGGRIQLSEGSYDKKHPIVIGKTHLAKLLLKHEHERLGHAGCNLTIASIRDVYWPISGKTSLKQIIHSCIRCFRVKPKILNPMMGNLPNIRINQAHPFYRSGVDYAGPILIKDKPGRGCKMIKSYICLFICMCTKAIHLELTTELSRDSFLAAFRRFISRRGTPQAMFSDNGTNFVAANKELTELASFIEQNQSNFAEVLETEGISWNFIPAYAPHFGGLWEAGVKQTKNHLRKLMGNVKLTYEQLNTILCQIEAILNSRPLCPLSSDPNDLCALTPGHFLIGRRIMSMPDQNYVEIPDNRLAKFQLVQKVQQQFWSRWHHEYLSELQIRNKWNAKQHPLKAGTMVLIKGEQTPPLRWPLGRIQQVLTGPDGVARVALVKTGNGIIKRAFSKLCPLPIEEGVCAQPSELNKGV